MVQVVEAILVKPLHQLKVLMAVSPIHQVNLVVQVVVVRLRLAVTGQALATLVLAEQVEAVKI
jgi:hypothetical protein